MTRVANLSANLTARTVEFDSRIQRSRALMTSAGSTINRSAGQIDRGVSGAFRRGAQSIAAFQGPLGPLSGRLSSIGTLAGGLGGPFTIAALAVTAYVAAIRSAVNTGEEFEKSQFRISAILRATGNASGQTAEGIREFARGLASATLASTRGVEEAAAQLLTFRSVSGETFTRTLTLAQDLAAAGFGSLSTNAVQLGKALEDPITGLTALQRVGVSFTQSQKELIKSLVETGDKAQAQSIILDTLAAQVGGAGAGEAGGLSGKYDSLSQKIEEFFLALDKATGASQLLSRALQFLIDDIDKTNRMLDPDNVPIGERISKELEAIKQAEAQLQSLRNMSAGNQALQAGQSQQVKEIENEIARRQENIRVLQQEAADRDQAAYAAQRQGESVQQSLQAEEQRAKALEVTAEADKKLAQASQQRQDAIDKNITGIENEIEALQLQARLLQDSAVSVEEAIIAREILSQQIALDIVQGSVEAQNLETLIRKREALTSAINDEIKERQRVKTEVQRIIDANKTREEQIQEEILLVEELYTTGQIGAEEYAKAIARLRDELDELDEGQQKAKELADAMGSAFESAFTDMVLGAKSAGEAMRALGKEILRAIFQQTVAKPIGGFISSALGSIFGGFFAEGGRPPLGKASVVGEQGPELFVPDTAGTIISNDQMGGGGTTIYADMRGASVEAVQRLEQFVSQINASLEPRAVQAVVNERARDPRLFGGSSR